jgi:hypothetical protein
LAERIDRGIGHAFKSNRAPKAAMPAQRVQMRVSIVCSRVALKDRKRDGHDVIDRFRDGVVNDSSVVAKDGDLRVVIEA